jgi:ribosomal protein S18 acetylase RimI-like enzyme
LTGMSRLEVRPFMPADVDEAGRLLASRHRRQRDAQPLMTSPYVEVDACVAELRRLLGVPDASGAVALRDGHAVGYVVGAPKQSPAWGPNLWVESAGQATEEPEVMRDLYATAAARWVDEGRTAQYVMVPATEPELLTAWYRLGFGQQHAHAIRVCEPMTPNGGLTIRRAERSDLPVLARLSLELPAHQAMSPTFSAGAVPSYEEELAEWEADFDDPDFANFVAEDDGRVVGSAIGCALERSGTHLGPARPEGAGFLGFAAVFPEARGRGAGRALGETVIGWCAEAGFASVVTDWRVTNLQSSRTWSALGFEETFIRVHRLLGY